MEDPIDEQMLVVGKSSRTAEERAEPNAAAEQHVPEHIGSEQRATEQECTSTAPTTEEPAATSGNMGFVLVSVESTDQATNEVPAPEAAISEEPEIEEIVCPYEEPVAPQRVRVGRKRGEEWVIHEDDYSDRAIRKLRRTVVDRIARLGAHTLHHIAACAPSRMRGALRGDHSGAASGSCWS